VSTAVARRVTAPTGFAMKGRARGNAIQPQAGLAVSDSDGIGLTA
jgi:hypothetical protein